MQSLARRQYNARQTDGSPIIENVTIDPACNWDAEAIQNALSQAQVIEDSDPGSAQQLRAQAQAAKNRLDGTSGRAEGYDPMKLLARVLYHYKGGITDSDLARMDYRRFFGYVRELDYILQDEANSNKGVTSKNTTSALRNFAAPEEYTGETVKLL